MLPSRHYESDHTKFIRELLEKRPQVDEDRRKGRAIWWDKQPRELAAAQRDGRRQRPAEAVRLLERVARGTVAVRRLICAAPWMK